MQQRLFHRVLLTAKSVVTFDDVIFKGKVENISLNGALISFGNDIDVNRGEKCFLTIYLEGENQPIRIIAEIVRSLRNMVGIKFVAMDAETQASLYEIIARLATEPANMKLEKERLKKYFDDYFVNNVP